MPNTIPVPQTAEELHEQLTDKTTMRALLRDPEFFAEHVENSINARLKDKGITDQVGEQTNAFMTQWLKDNARNVDDETMRRLNLDSPNARGGRFKPNTVYNKGAIGAAHDSAFATMTEYLHSISDHAAKDAVLS